MQRQPLWDHPVPDPACPQPAGRSSAMGWEGERGSCPWCLRLGRIRIRIRPPPFPKSPLPFVGSIAATASAAPSPPILSNSPVLPRSSSVPGWAVQGVGRAAGGLSSFRGLNKAHCWPWSELPLPWPLTLPLCPAQLLPLRSPNTSPDTPRHTEHLAGPVTALAVSLGHRSQARLQAGERLWDLQPYLRAFRGQSQEGRRDW